MLSHRITDRFRKHFFSSQADRSLIVDNFAQVAKDCKHILGPRSIVVSSLEESHKTAAGKIWFELQKVGIQSTFLNLKSRFPSVESIQDGVNLVKRTGATSIVTIGNGTLTDYGKALQFAADASSNMTSVLQDPTTITSRRSAPRIAHIAIPVTPTLNHFLSTSQIIHHEDDILIEIPTTKPSIVCRDPQFSVLGSLYHSSNITKASIIASLFDDLIACFLTNTDEAIARAQVELVLNAEEFKSKFEAIYNNSELALDSRPYSIALESVATIRSEMRRSLTSTAVDIPEAWPSPLNLIAMLMQTNLSLKFSLPYSFHIITATGSLLHHHTPKQRRRYVSVADKKLLAGIDFAMSTLTSTLSLSEKEVKAILVGGMSSIEELVNKQAKLFVAPKVPQQRSGSGSHSQVEALTAAGNIEKVSVFLDYLVEKQEKNSTTFAEKKLLLRSDIVLDIIEAMIESDSSDS